MEFDYFEGADFKYDNSFFKALAQKYAKKVFFVPSLGGFVFQEIFQLDRFVGPDFKYDYRFF